MILASIATFFLLGFSTFFFAQEVEITGEPVDIFGKRFSVTQELLQSPHELFQLSERLEEEGNLKEAVLCWKLLNAIEAPWRLRARALLGLAKYYSHRKSYKLARDYLELVMGQDEDPAAKMLAQRRYSRLPAPKATDDL